MRSARAVAGTLAIIFAFASPICMALASYHPRNGWQLIVLSGTLAGAAVACAVLWFLANRWTPPGPRGGKMIHA